MTEEIKAIPTRYAGCHFRSRLEARWAVFFDRLDIEWEYEPQGYDAGGVRYLPDFWLPRHEIFVEVKGVMSHDDFMKIGAAIPELPRIPECRARQAMPALLLLGPVPRPGAAWLHSQLYIVEDGVVWHYAYFSTGSYLMVPLHRQIPLWPFRPGITADDTELFRRDLLDPAHEPRVLVDPLIDAAYAAARSARFEYGQEG